MAKVTTYFSSNDNFGNISFNAKYEESFYKKHFMNYFEWTGCGKEISLKDLRYINYSDIIGFVRSRASELPKLCHKNPYHYYPNPVGFDHTTYWRKIGIRYPLFCLTEPYHLPSNYEKSLEEEKDYYKTRGMNLEYKIYEPSEKSLWVPNKTYMIFWWCPDYFNFKEYEELLMSHQNANEFAELCEIGTITRK
jgi:hypothetical protein